MDQEERIDIVREMEQLFLEEYPPGIIAYIDTALVFWNYFQGYEAHYGNNYIGRTRLEFNNQDGVLGPIFYKHNAIA
jgi:hypothetical protein